MDSKYHGRSPWGYTELSSSKYSVIHDIIWMLAEKITRVRDYLV